VELRTLFFFFLFIFFSSHPEIWGFPDNFSFKPFSPDEFEYRFSDRESNFGLFSIKELMSGFSGFFRPEVECGPFGSFYVFLSPIFPFRSCEDLTFFFY